MIEDFVRDYWAVRLPPVGNPGARTPALYFPNIETRDELRGAVESALALRGIGTDTILAVDGKAAKPRAASLNRDPQPRRSRARAALGQHGH